MARVVEKSALNLTVRVHIAFAIVAALFFTIVLRLWYLQVLGGDYFRNLAENNRIRTVFVPPPRGLIFDRNGKVIVQNRPSFNIEMIEEDSPNPRETVIKLAKALGMSSTILLDRFKYQHKRRRFEPKLLIKDASRDVVARVSARAHDLPGIMVNVQPARQYLYDDFASHVIGYIREITRKQLDSPSYPGYRQGDIVGQFGVEKKWEVVLQGKRGVQNVIVNATGARIGTQAGERELAGKNITLTLDFYTQQAADNGLKGHRGAIVAISPKTGEILALSSAPTFDPNTFAGDLSAETWRDLVSGPEKRMNNRAVQGAYPPGSIFKFIMAVAGLSEGVIGQNDHVTCPGSYRVGSAVFRCHKKTGHGSVDLHQAIIKSCDVYFYTVGTRLGVDRIHEYSAKFGLGEKTGLELVDENPGLIPSTEWKKRAHRDPGQQKWFPGETPSVSIGQGAVSVTPIQMAVALSALVNGGRVLIPHIIRMIESSDAKFRDDTFKPQERKLTLLDPKVVDIARKGLVGVVNDIGGTGGRSKLSPDLPIIVGGKTGTAQAAGDDARIGGKKIEDHAWFVAYAPAEDPEIVVAAIVENGGHGGVTAAPIVKQVLEAYFRKGNPPPPALPEVQKKAGPAPVLHAEQGAAGVED